MVAIAQTIGAPLEEGLGPTPRLHRAVKGRSLQAVTLRGGAAASQLSPIERGLEVDDQTFRLKAGDTFAIDSQNRLRVRCEAAEPCELIWTVPPTYS